MSTKDLYNIKQADQEPINIHLSTLSITRQSIHYTKGNSASHSKLQ